MILRRSLVPLALMSLGIAASAGCKDDPPPPTAEPTNDDGDSGDSEDGGRGTADGSGDE